MKKRVLSAFLCGLACCVCAQELPRLVVVAFTPNGNTREIQTDTVTVRNLVESRMVSSGRYEVISREEIDKLLENQQIQANEISSKVAGAATPAKWLIPLRHCEGVLGAGLLCFARNDGYVSFRE